MLQYLASGIQQKHSAEVKGQMHHVESLPSVELSPSSAFDIDQQLFSNINLFRHSSSSTTFFFITYAPAQNSLSIPFIRYTARRRLQKSHQGTGPELILPFVPANGSRLVCYRVFKNLY